MRDYTTKDYVKTYSPTLEPNGDESYKNDESEKSETGKLSLFSPFVAAAAAAVRAYDGKYTGNTCQFRATSQVLWRESAAKRTE